MLPSEHPNQGHPLEHTHRTNRHKGLTSTHVNGGQAVVTSWLCGSLSSLPTEAPKGMGRWGLG